MSQDLDRAQLLLQLVDHSLRKAGVADSSRHALTLYSLVVRLLNSGLTSSTLHDEQALLHALQQHVEQRGGGRDAGQRLLEAHSKLQSVSSLQPQTRTALLALLSRLATDERSKGNDIPVLGTTASTMSQYNLTSSLPMIHPSMQHTTAALDTASTTAAEAALQRRQQQQAYTVTFPPSLEGSFSEPTARRTQGRGTGRSGTQTNGGASNMSDSWEHASSFSVTEPLLVRDILYACQGIAGKFTVYKEDAATTLSSANSGTADGVRHPDASRTRDQDGSGGGFEVVPEAQVPQTPERMLVSRLTELGWLFKRIQAKMSSAASKGSVGVQGAIRQALHGALQAELADFYRLMAVLEHHAAQPMPLPGESASSGTYLTLRRLVVWLGEPTRRMRHLALVADTVDGKSGGALAGTVHMLAKHGDPFVACFTTKLLHAVCVPLFNMIRRWVFEGVLEDPYNEFFVRAAPWVAAASRAKLTGELASLSLGSVPVAAGSGMASGNRDLWRDGYQVDRTQLPAFISDELACKVLRAGKSINYLQGVCGDVHWAQEAGAIAAASAMSQATNPGALEALERAVDTAATLVDARVMEVLHSRYQLGKHCDAVRRYLLLGQGDFVQALMELVSGELDHVAAHVSEVQLGHALRTAITSSCAKYDDDEVLDRLRARKDRSATAAESGWDVFTLQYDVPTPLATIFTPTAMSQYLRVFKLLWSLKRAEASLAACWTLLQCSVQRTLAKLDPTGRGGADGVLRRCLRLRADMAHFVTNLQYYLMLEVMEAAWQEFTARVGEAANLDALITAHEAYLSTLLRKALLDADSEGLRRTLDQMMQNMLVLHGLARNLFEVVAGTLARQDARAKQVKERTDKGQWGTRAGEGALVGVPANELDALSRQLNEMQNIHARLLQTFTTQLPAQAHDEVRFLLYRLDFNEFSSKTWRMSEDGV